MSQLTNDHMNYLASGKYIQKMHLLNAYCNPDNAMEDINGKPSLYRDDHVRDREMPTHIMYKYGSPLISKDRCRAYTFNIEYCTDNPSEGIYYGAFGIVLQGTIDEHKETFDREWAILRPLAAQALGNTFGNSHFDALFRQTDNVDDNTYWPFWISLAEGENIVEVAFRAVRILRHLYEDLLAHGTSSYITPTRKKEVQEYCYPCTEKAFEQIGKNGTAPNIKDEILRFFKWCENHRLIYRNQIYDMAWSINECSSTELAFLIDTYFTELHSRGIYKKGSTPWKAIGNVLLNSDGSIIGEPNLKMLISQLRDEKHNKKRHEILRGVKDRLKNYFT